MSMEPDALKNRERSGIQAWTKAMTAMFITENPTSDTVSKARRATERLPDLPYDLETGEEWGKATRKIGQIFSRYVESLEDISYFSQSRTVGEIIDDAYLSLNTSFGDEPEGTGNDSLKTAGFAKVQESKKEYDDANGKGKCYIIAQEVCRRAADWLSYSTGVSWMGKQCSDSVFGGEPPLRRSIIWDEKFQALMTQTAEAMREQHQVWERYTRVQASAADTLAPLGSSGGGQTEFPTSVSTVKGNRGSVQLPTVLDLY